MNQYIKKLFTAKKTTEPSLKDKLNQVLTSDRAARHNEKNKGLR